MNKIHGTGTGFDGGEEYKGHDGKSMDHTAGLGGGSYTASEGDYKGGGGQGTCDMSGNDKCM